MTEGCGIPAQVNCCEGLTFKANLIRLNHGVQLADKQMAMKAFHDVVAYEKKEKAAGRFDEDGPDFDGVMECFFGHSDFDKINDDDIFNALTFMMNHGEKVQLKPRECGYYNCDKKEKMNGDFNLCSKCHKQPYCGKECQVSDWKIHKQLCCGKNKTNIEDSTLMMITKQVVENHAATVDMRSRTKISVRQRDAATAAVLKKLMKMFTGEFSHFNSPHAIADAGLDPAVSQELADFFAEQPGFEKVWGELRVGYRERLELEREVTRNSNSLTISDDVIRDIVKDIAHQLTMSIGNLMCDGDTSKNLEKHNSLVDALVEHTKEFILEHKEYDSFVGLQQIAKNADYKLKIASIICDVYNTQDE
jgi:hypothetical protein